MCGICGQFNFKKREPVDAGTLRRMTDSIAHRGPDDEGTHFDGELALGFRRLSIIDLAAGHQPMADAEGKIWLVFNGEIYNFKELRRELESFGHRFRTNSDTEVIIYGYKQWGIDVVDHLNGMFGFAIWDSARRRLMVARDRAGIKPIYYSLTNDSLTFGSEMRPVIAGIGHRPAIDPTALNLFLRYRYTPAPQTIYQGIRKLAPGTRIVIENDEARVERWWNFKPKPFDPPPSEKQAEEELLELYKKAVERQLVSDVPLGLLLSGGVDSGLLLALMNNHGRDWKTFTVGFGTSYASDELTDAARTAEILGNHNSAVQIDRNAFEDVLSKIVSIVEEPIATPSVVPMYFVCQRARQDVTVALMGQGPDELFGGYKRHLGVQYGHYWRSIPSWLQVPAASALKAVSRKESVQRGLYSLGVADRMKRYQHVFSIMPGNEIDGLFADGLLPPGAGDTVLDCWSDLKPLMEDTDELGGFNFLEIRSSLPDELMMYADKISMHHGLEVRVPFLDHDIIEYAERLPAKFKVHNRKRKWLHANVCRNYLPEEIIKRKKRGFAVDVVNDWFKDSMAGKIDHVLLDNRSLMYSILRHDKVEQLVSQHQKGQADNHKVLFSLVVLEEWMRQLND